MEIAEVLGVKRDQVLNIAHRHGAHHVRIFGSVARGEAGPLSDIDFLVEMEPGRSLLDLGGLVSDLQQLLGCSVDVITERGLKPRIRARVLEEAIPL
jgi:predicted nucleotidyltransferase